MQKFSMKEIRPFSVTLNKITFYEIEAKSITAAKRAATRAQKFKSSTLVLLDCKGVSLVIKQGGRWHAA